MLRENTHAKGVKHGRYLVAGVRAQLVAREILATFEQDKLTVTAYVHVVLVKKGRALLYVVHLDVFSPALTLSDEATVIRRVLARLP
jgi:hypothetical protein